MYTTFLDETARVFTEAYAPNRTRSPLLDAAVRHATTFGTWQSLIGVNHFNTSHAIALMTAMVESAVLTDER